MLLPTRKIESKEALEEQFDKYLRWVREGRVLTIVEIREFTLLMSILQMLAGAALDTVAQGSTTPEAQAAVISAVIRNTARKLALALGFEMKTK